MAVLAAVGASSAYVATRSHKVASTAVVQLTPQAVTSPVTVQLPTTATSSQAIAYAAGILHQSVAQTAAEAGGVTSSLNSSSNQISITDTGTSPADTQSIADAFAQSYVASIVSQEQSTLARLTANQASLKKQITRYQTALSGGANSLITTELNAATQAYGTLEAQIIALNTSPPAATIYSQALPGAPTGSATTKILGVALLIGLITGGGISLIRDRFDTRLRLDASADSSVGLPVLAELPFDHKVDPRLRLLPVVDDSMSVFAGRVRELRSAIQTIVEGQKSSVILVTSPSPGDGKSFITANLASSWALAGRKTLAISTDLRRPRLDGLLGISASERGLSTLLAAGEIEVPFPEFPSLRDLPNNARTRRTARREGQQPGGLTRSLSAELTPEERDRLSAVCDYVVETRVKGLSLLPAGPPVETDPADLLASHTMHNLVTALRYSYEFIVIDTPAALAVADAGTLVGLADGVVLVARANQTDMATLRQTKAQLEADGANIFGLVVNLTRSPGSEHSDYYYVSRPGERDMPPNSARPPQ